MAKLVHGREHVCRLDVAWDGLRIIVRNTLKPMLDDTLSSKGTGIKLV